ncbi:MAG: serine/threonine protein kinase [Cyanobacteria bacterium SZAS TMP-1]|nr:serine/threonine protein kinase [Cyanobacteria bacterium SZAS TMP-1]
MTDTTLVPFGTRSMVARWFDQYLSEGDRRALPWLCVILLGAALAFGPPFLLWLVGLLPADELGNSGASIFAHQVVVTIASVLAFCLAAGILRLLTRPSFIELDARGIAMVWSILFFRLRGSRLPWSEITSVGVFQPTANVDFTQSRLNFATAQDIAALSIPLAQIDGEERRQQVADAISKYAQNNVEPRVFAELAPQRELSFTSLWLEALTAAPSRERLLPVSIGTILDGRYCVKDRLGAGGQGTIYLAEDIQDAKQVVLKESILPVYTNIVKRRQALEAFHKEAFALESVKHDNVVRYLGSFVVDHRAYLVLQLVPGRTLSAMVKEDGPLNDKRVVAMAMQMCDILSHLHGLTPPLVHRDFTPDNLIVDNNDKITLIDFAVSVAAWSPDSESDEIAGKAAYMAPEQFKGTPQGQSDVYSMGATMHYLLTGETPEPLDESHPILINASVGKELSDIVAGATRLDLDKRFKSAESVKDALKALP